MISTTIMGDDKSDKLSENKVRQPLGDVTNQIRKRGFSLISSSPSKSGIGNKGLSESGSIDDSQFWKQVALVVEKLEKERGNTVKCPKVLDESGLSPLKGGKIYRLHSPLDAGTSNAQMSSTSACRVVKENPSVSALDNIDLGEAQGDCEVPKDSCVPNVMVDESSKDCQRECQGQAMPIVANQAENDCSQEVVAAKVEGSRLIESRDMGSFSLERCSNLSADLDSLKSCSCAFCTKVAYIWSDLHYQDVKDRISTLMDSQQTASNLAQRYIAGTEVSKHAQEESSKITNTETELTNQWKSLFLHMENIFGSESSLLQSNFLALKDIREDFKTNAEMINGLPSDVQPSSSDASEQVII